MTKSRKQQGLAILEVAAVLVIVAILLAIAVPSYRQSMLKSHRAEGRAALTEILSAQES